MSTFLSAPVLFLATVLSGFLIPSHVVAASYTWDGGGVTNNWSDCANWTSDICPTAGDSATFNSTSTKDSVIDTSFSGVVNVLTIQGSYTGSVTMERSLTLTNSFTHSGLAFDAGSHSMVVGGVFTLGSGAAFTAPSTTLTVGSTFTINTGVSFLANNGTVILNGTGNVVCNGTVFNSVQFTYAGTSTKAVADSCSLPLGTDPVVSSRLSVSGELVGSGTLNFAGAANSKQTTGVFTGFDGFIGALAVQGGTLDFGSYALADFVTFSVAAGATFTAPSGDMSVANTFTINAAGTFHANGGTVIFDGGSATLTCGNTVFNLVVFSGGVNKGVSSDCSMPLGDDPVITGSIGLNGTFSGTGTLTMTTFTLQNGSNLVGFDGLITNNTFTVNGSVDFSTYTTFDVNTSFTLNNGAVFTAPGGVATFAGAFTLNSGSTFDANSGTVVFDGAGTATIACNGATFNLVQISHTSNTKIISDGCTLPLGNDPTVSATIIVNGVLTGTGTLTRPLGATTVNATGNITGFSALHAAAVVINSATLDWEDYDSITTNAFTASSTILDWAAIGSLQVNGVMTLTNVTLTVPPVTDINGSLIMNTGTTFTASSGTMYLGGNFTLNSGATFNHNNGTLYLDGAGGAFECNNTTFNLIVIDKRTLGDGTVNASCSFPLGHDPIVYINSSSSGWNINGTFTGSGILTTQGVAVGFNAPGGISGFDGIVGRLVYFNGGTVDFSNFSPTTFVTLRLRNSVSFTAPSSELSVNSLYIESGASFDANGGTVVMQGNDSSSATFNLECSDAVFNLVRLEAINRISIADDCTLPLGDNPTIAGPEIRQKLIGRQTTQLAGKLVGTGTLTVYGVLRFDSGYQLDGFSDIVTDNLTVNNTDVDFSSLDSLTILTDVAITGSLTPPSLMNVGGNFTNTIGSTFNPAGGTVLLTGTDQALTGDTEFHNLTKQTSGTLTIGAGNTVTVNGLLNLSLSSLVSSVLGSTWNIDIQGTSSVCSVSVTDSVGTGDIITAYDSVSNSANPGWIFSSDSCSGFDGGGGSEEFVNAPTSPTTNNTSTSASRDSGAEQMDLPSDKEDKDIPVDQQNSSMPEPETSSGDIEEKGNFNVGNIIFVSVIGVSFFGLCMWFLYRKFS